MRRPGLKVETPAECTLTDPCRLFGATAVTPKLRVIGELYILWTPPLLASVSFASVTTWALGGQLMRRWIRTPRRARILGIAIAREFEACTDAPLLTQSNAGRTEMVDGQVVYGETPEFMAEKSRELVEVGVNIVGGCCGTAPEHTRALRAALGGRPRSQSENHRTVVIDPLQRGRLIPRIERNGMKSPRY